MQQRYETFTVLINRIGRNIRRIQNQEMATFQLRSVHVSCIYYIYSMGSATATDLCERCEEDKATISRALDFLETNGYLSCEPKNSKRYKAPLLLTELGLEAGKKISDKIACVLNETSVGLTEAERAEFYRCLSIISKNLDVVSKNNTDKE